MFMMYTLKIFAIIVFIFPIMAYAQDNKTVSIVVKVSGIQSDKGSIQVALFSTEASFPNEKPYQAKKYPLKASEKVVEIAFDNVPIGDYAVAVYQDKNDNDKLDTNFVGFPQEPYGFSNKHNPKLSAPKYQSAKVKVDQARQVLEVSID